MRCGCGTLQGFQWHPTSLPSQHVACSRSHHETEVALPTLIFLELSKILFCKACRGLDHCRWSVALLCVNVLLLVDVLLVVALPLGGVLLLILRGGIGCDR